jgi:Carboxypeptidase regulatory-like domain
MAVVNYQAHAVGGRAIAILAAAATAVGVAAIPAVATAAAVRPSSPSHAARSHAASSLAVHTGSQLTALTMLEQRARARLHWHLPHASAITGTVVGAYGLPVTGLCVTAVSSSRSVTASASPSGAFTIAGLAAGSYALEYRDCAAVGRYRAIWSGGAGRQRTAARVQIGASQVRHVPVMMMPPLNFAAARQSAAATWHRFLANARGLGAVATAKTGQISGVVTGKGKKLRGVCIVVFPVNGGQGYGATTGKNGSYVLRHVPAGHYDVTFADTLCFSNQNWLEQTYRDHNNPFEIGGDPVKVTSGKTTKGINGKLLLGGEVSGIVTTKSGKKLGGICVDAEGTVAGGFVGIVLPTSGNGSYQVHALFPGKYTVDFSIGCGNNKNYAPAALKPVRITYGKRVVARRVVLVPGGVITGTVRLSSSSGVPLAGICVQASGPEIGIGIGSPGPGNAATNSAGRYRLIGLGTGTYQVQFSAGCNNNGNYVPATTDAHATAGKVTGNVNVVLLPGAEISGTVTDTRGNPLAGICMQVNGPSSGNSSGATFNDGSYFVNQLPAGTYQLGFFAGCGGSGNYAPYWYNNQTDQSLATPIKLTRGASLTINAQMRPGAEISGTVTDIRGRKLDQICVTAATPMEAQSFGGFEQLAPTFHGTYHIAGLAPGQYMVEFNVCGDERYAVQWFPGAPSSGAAEIISVPVGQTTGINAVLPPSGSITGVVRGPSGKPLAGICVSDVNTRGSGVLTLGGGIGPTTDSRGAYRISGLAPGRYDVLFSQCTVNARYPDQWYRGQNSQLSATPVRVRAGATTSGIDATMRPGGTVTGRVVDSAGKPLNNICPFAFNPNTGQFGFATTGRTGTYTMRGLATGSYTVSFSPCNPAVNLVTVTRHIKVTASHTTSGVNARLSPGGSASGTVTVAGSAALVDNVCVEFISANPNNPGGFGFTGADGTYLATGLAPGSYQVYFNDPSCFFGKTGLAPQWYNGQPRQATANKVTITVGHTTAGINAALQTDGTITGTVLGPSSAALGGVCVTAMPLAAGSVPVVAVSGKSGGFTLLNMLPRRYKVEFSSGCGATGYRTQWWQNAGSRQAATAINVSAAQTVTGIDATLRH